MRGGYSRGSVPRGAILIVGSFGAVLRYLDLELRNKSITIYIKDGVPLLQMDLTMQQASITNSIKDEISPLQVELEVRNNSIDIEII